MSKTSRYYADLLGDEPTSSSAAPSRECTQSEQMRLLLTNDDGIDAPGLQALVAAAKQFGEPVVVAPAGPQSGVSHAVSENGVLLEEQAAARFAVSGTPADCARLGLLRAVPEARWVLSGINHGGNLGADVYYSGTVAAIREAVLHGWPGIALSQYHRDELSDYDWHRASDWTRRILADLLARPVEPGLFYNVNLPHLGHSAAEPEIIFCRLDPHPLPLSYRHEEGGRHFYNGNYHERQRQPGADVDVCFSGNIAVTEMRLF
jgi:5'/3'-nucleotidase